MSAFVFFEAPVSDAEGFFATLLALIEHGIGEGFVRPGYRNLWMSSTSPVGIVDALRTFRPERSPEQLEDSQRSLTKSAG